MIYKTQDIYVKHKDLNYIENISLVCYWKICNFKLDQENKSVTKDISMTEIEIDRVILC